MEKLTDEQLKSCILQGKKAERILTQRYSERLAMPVREKISKETLRERHGLFKQIKSSEVHADWQSFQTADRIRLQELLEDGVIFEITNKNGRKVFKASEKPLNK